MIDVDGAVKSAVAMTPKPASRGALDGWPPAVEELGPMPDAAMTVCVVKAFTTLRFPPPKGGPLTFTYPIMFSPGG